LKGIVREIFVDKKRGRNGNGEEKGSETNQKPNDRFINHCRGGGEESGKDCDISPLAKM